MANDKLVPAYLQVLYHSAKAPHVATIPLKGLVDEETGVPPFLQVWDGDPVDSSIVIPDFIDLWAGMVDDALTFDRWAIYSRESNEAPPVWVWEEAHSQVGTATIVAGQTFAVQHTMSFRSALGGLYKLVTLDRNSGGFWGRSYVPNVAEQAVIDFIISDDSFIAARDNSRPVAFLRLTVSENDRLAREYHQSLT